MKVSRQELAQRLERAKERLREAGIKLTHQRLEIFKEVASSDEHPDAETIYRRLRKRIPTISLDTVYRTLYLLSELGLIEIVGTRKYMIRFEGDTSPHHHFVCKRCGKISDFDCQELDQIPLLSAINKLGRVDKARLEIYGICFSCSDPNKTKKGGKKRWKR